MTMALGRSDVKYIRRELLYTVQQVEGKPVTIDDLAATMDCAYSTVLRHLKALKQQGYVDWKIRKGRDTGGSIYQLSEKAAMYLKDTYGSR
jgi:predicted ArsR family transcriptional regulator